MKDQKETGWKGFVPENAIVMARKGPRKKKSTSKESHTLGAIQDNAPLADWVPLVGDTLDKIRADLGSCQRCKLSKTRNHLVFGEGNPKAELVLVGEAPGEQEDLSGRPFVGRAGQLLEKMIQSIGLERTDIYICNVVKSRPPENRNPEPDEIQACQPFLLRQLDVIRPKIILALGKFASQTLLKTETRISDLRGNFYPYRGARLIPTFHPSYLLRNPSAKREVWEDLKKVAGELGLQVKS